MIKVTIHSHAKEKFMITELPRAEVIAFGARNKAGYLLEQFGYTMELAKAEGEALAELLPKGYLAEVAAAAEEVRKAQGNRLLTGEETKGATQKLNELIRKSKVWRRTIVSRAQRAKKLGKKIPDALLRSDGIDGVPRILAQMEKMIRLVEANEASLPGARLGSLIAEGKALAEGIGAIDAEQEVKKLKTLPDAVSNFYYYKGLLLVGLKVMNDAGRELHVSDPAAASKYNLSILYRNVHRKRKAGKSGSD